MVTAMVWKLVRRPQGGPRKEDFVCVEEMLPPCAAGGVVVEAEYLSVDPYLCFLIKLSDLNTTVVGEQLARVIETKNCMWPIGSLMMATLGWRTHTYIRGPELYDRKYDIKRLPDLEKLPVSISLGVLGIPGNAAYIGFMEVARPKAGETVLVNAAAGTLGSTVVQLAKMAGCQVVAFGGSRKDVEWLTKLGADHVFNYKTDRVKTALDQTVPQGINIYFDNVGGKFTSEVIPHMAVFGRVIVCGTISTYSDEGDALAPSLNSPLNQNLILWNELTVKGFIVENWKHRWDASFTQMKKWVQEGRLKYRECIVEGFEETPHAFISIFRGVTSGKVLVKP